MENEIDIDYSKKEFSEEETNFLKNKLAKLSKKFPDYIPVFIHTANNIKFNKNKYLVKKDITFASFIYKLKNQSLNSLKKNEALFFFINDSLVPNSKSFLEIYNEFKNPKTGHLCIFIYKENTFGGS